MLFTEANVRAELMEQVPHIAIFCQENRPSISYAFSKYLLPFMVRCLADSNNQVNVIFFFSLNVPVNVLFLLKRAQFFPPI